ncbi:MAG: hypothetical protein U1E72_12705 [Burkholderiaceae bacterium]
MSASGAAAPQPPRGRIGAGGRLGDIGAMLGGHTHRAAPQQRY